MSVQDPQPVDPQEFIDVAEYHFTGYDVTVANKCTFIEQLRLKAAVYLAAQAAGVSKMTVYRWREQDEQFAAAWDEALEDAADIMETSTYEDALAGNALLKMFWLKAHRHKFRDKVAIDITSVQDEIERRMQQVGAAKFPRHFLPPSNNQQKDE